MPPLIDAPSRKSTLSDDVFTGDEQTDTPKVTRRSDSETHDDVYSRSDSDDSDTDSEEPRHEDDPPPPSSGHQRHDSTSRLHPETEIADRFLNPGMVKLHLRTLPCYKCYI